MHIFKQFALERNKLFIRVAAVLVALLAAVMLLSQPASAKMTYVIADGGRIVVHTTTATDPETVLGEAGLALGADDTYTTQEIAGISEISIHRNMAVSIDYYGEKMEVRSDGETVRQLLKRLNLSWNSGDEISQPLDAQVTDGMELRLYKLVRQEQIYSAVLDYETVYCSDQSLPTGTEKVLTEGVDGEVVCNAMVTYINGVETGRTVLQERVTRQPVNKVVAVGCAEVVEEEVEAEEMEEEEPLTYSIDGNTITLSTGEVLTYTDARTFKASAYTHTDAGCDMITSTGTRVRWGTVAVDPRYIPYGTKMFIVSNDGYMIYGEAVAEDCGGAIKNDKVDLYMPTRSQCLNFGRRTCTVYFLN